MKPAVDLLVVGAGPTGLTLALQAALMGARVRVIDQLDQPRPWAPALAIHPRTMETLRGLGVADHLMARGLSGFSLEIHVGDRVVKGTLGELGLPATEYPFVFFAPQPEVEAVLRQRLADLGVEVEWSSRFESCQPRVGDVVCTLDLAGLKSEVHVRYLAGCDGADSAVRREAGIAFRGRAYRESISIADAGPTADLESGTAHAFVGARGILFFFPLPSGRWRLIGPGETPGGMGDLIEEHTGGKVHVADIDWAEVIRPRHQLAQTYRLGRVFLAGDAAHVHSPAGAQGMNTGIQDAANLGWKLALALRGAPEALLDTYEAERRPVARGVVRLTGLAFALEVSELAPLRWGRRWAAQPLARLLLPHPRLISAVARLLSGLDTRYVHGAVEGARGVPRKFRPGRRFPDYEIEDFGASRAHRLMAADRFHVFVFDGRIDFERLDRLHHQYADLIVSHRHESLRRRPSWALVRPDGYIAVSGMDLRLEAVGRYMNRWLGSEDTTIRSRRGPRDTHHPTHRMLVP